MSKDSQYRQVNHQHKRQCPRGLIVICCIGIGILVLLLFLNQTSPPIQDKLASKSLPPTPDNNNRRTTCTSSRCIESAGNLVASMNTSVDPCEDFFEYACGGWIRRNPVPSYASKWSQFAMLNADNNKVTQDILSQPVQTSDPFALKQAKEFYTACADVNELDRVGLNHIISIIDNHGGWPIIKPKVDSWTPSFDLMRSMATFKRLGTTSAVFDFHVIESTNPLRKITIINIAQPSLFLARPYLLDPKTYSRHIQAYKTFVMEMAIEFAKVKGIALDQAELINSTMELISFESNLAELTADNEELHKKTSVYSVPLESFQQMFDDDATHNGTIKIDLNELLEWSSRSNNTSNVKLLLTTDPAFILNVNLLITSTSPRIIMNYLHYRILASFASDTTLRMREIASKYQRQVLGLETASREFICVSRVVGIFGVALSRPHLEKTKISNTEVNQVVKMVEDIRQSFLSLLDGANWMTKKVKNDLKKKAGTSIKSCVGVAPWMFPSNNSTLYEQNLREQFNGLDLGQGTTYLQKQWRFLAWHRNNVMNRFIKRFTPGCGWTTYFGIVNAFYDPKSNTINFPLGILQPPFFYNDKSFTSVNFGSIGSIIGHELTHGVYLNTWSMTDDGSFTPISECLVDQFNAYKADKDVSGGTINGIATLEENFADNGGLMAAFKAYRKFSHKSIVPAIPGLEGFTQDQLFFLGYASSHCSSSRQDWSKEIIPLGSSDVSHAPDRFRVLGTLQNSKEFTQAWKCRAGSNLNPQDVTRCNVF